MVRCCVSNNQSDYKIKIMYNNNRRLRPLAAPRLPPRTCAQPPQPPPRGRRRWTGCRPRRTREQRPRCRRACGKEIHCKNTLVRWISFIFCMSIELFRLLHISSTFMKCYAMKCCDMDIIAASQPYTYSNCKFPPH